MSSAIGYRLVMGALALMLALLTVAVLHSQDSCVPALKVHDSVLRTHTTALAPTVVGDAALADKPLAQTAIAETQRPSATSQPAAYVPPPGIPSPSFGIDESHMMYASGGHTYDYGSGSEPYRIGANGPYTHYVDPSASNSTDSSNPFGTPDRPRRTVPTSLPAGSVVEAHGTFTSGWTIDADGTADRPVFIRGANANDRVVLAASASVRGQYAIWENILQTGQRSFSVSDYSGRVPHHVAIRHCELAGNGDFDTGIAMAVYGNTGLNVHDVVLYDNHIHHQGDSEADTTTDRHGIAVTRHTYNIWVLDNWVHHSQADAIQVNGWVNETTHHIYIGGNTFHDDGENAIDIKEASHVIISGNEMFGYTQGDGAACNSHCDDGQVIGPDNVWVMFNEIHDSIDGIVSMGVKGKFHAIGNVIYNMSDAGLKSWSDGDQHYIGNTIYNTRRAIAHSGGDPVTMINNIICEASDYHVYLPSAAGVSTAHNNLYYGGQLAIRWGGGTYSSISSFRSATGEGAGSLEASPQFVSAGGADFRVASSSPAIDAGSSTSNYCATFQSTYGLDISCDVAGIPLPQGSGEDIGAHEWSDGDPVQERQAALRPAVEQAARGLP